MSNHSGRHIIDNENGFVLVLAMLIMIVLIVIGVTAIKNSSMGLRIAGNEKVAKQIFYQAESGVYERAQKIENTDNATGDSFYSGPPISNILMSSTWPAAFVENSSLTDNVTTIQSLVIDNGVDENSSLDVTESRLHNLDILSIAFLNNGRGEKAIGIGFKKRY